ncbi:MAG: LamG-like jellyroll fold domain-containing protein, partial [Saprospiraceae bacterium]
VVSTVAISVFFQSPWSELTMTQPEDGWSVRQSDNNQMVVRMRDYDVNDLDQVTIQYAPVGTSNWTDGEVLEANVLVDAPTGTEVIWDVSNLPEGNLNIRLRLSCGTNTIYAPRVTGVIDRQAPEIFGLTQPADDNFQTGDEVSITFAETLDCTGLSAADVQLKRVYTNETIAATLTCFNNKVVVIPSIDLASLFGEPLQVTLFNIKDLYGNTRINPPTWEFVAGGNTNSFDLDNDAVVNARDMCPGFDDNIDTDGDGMPDGCDACADSPNVGLSFYGIDDRIELPATLGNFGTGDFTIEMWIKTNVSTYDAIISKGSICDEQPYWGLIIDTDGRLHWNCAEADYVNDQSVLGNTPILDNRWHHIAVVRDQSSTAIYIDGFIDISTDFNSVNDYNNNIPITIGSDFCYSSFNGQMDELRFWNVARTAGDLNESMNKEMPSNEANLLAYYNFNEGMPNADNQSLTTIADMTTNGYTGTLNNFTRTGATSNWSIGSPVQHLDINKNGFGDVCESSALPLRYITLVGDISETENQLTWAVEGASQISTYQIERKAKGGDFSQLANISATDEKLYTWIDAAPFTESYYRIIALDELGQTAFSNIILLERPIEKVFELTKVFPNPTSELVNIDFVSPSAAEIQVAILDAVGRLVKQQRVPAQAGQNRVQLEVRSFTAGVYFIKMVNETGMVEVKQLVVE